MDGVSPSTFENPHRCDHCAGVHLELSTIQPTLLCYWCHYRGPLEVSENGEPRCVACKVRFEVANGTDYEYSAKLPYTFTQVAEAAKDGCELYRWIHRLTSPDGEVDFHPAPFWYQTKDRDENRDWDGRNILKDDEGKYRIELRGQNKSAPEGLTLKMEVHDKTTGTILIPSSHMRELDVWAAEDDPASKYTSLRPYVQDVMSEKSMNFARSCFQTCMESHPWCRTDQVIHLTVDRVAETVLEREEVACTDIPTRLIDLGTPAHPHLKLVEPHADGQQHLLKQISQSGFMALSYCWGGDQKAKLTTSNHTSYTRSIPLPSLDRTLQDAIHVARAIGFQHLWIDSLCILQDDDLDNHRITNPDKAYEITRMASYYGRATLTLLAASSPSASTGFLSPRPPAPLSIGPILLPLRSPQTNTPLGNLLLAEELPFPPPEPITTRGWTLQESLLSRRILIFSTRQLYYSCVNSFAGCGGTHPSLTPRVIPGRSSLVDGIYPVGSLSDSSTILQWQVVVTEYTKRHLGSPSDKLWAVSALASQIVKVARHRGEKLVYVAGLMVDPDDSSTWLTQLTWKPARPANQPRPRGRYRAPSWSWACLDSEVESGWGGQKEHAAVVEEYHVELAVPGAEYGAIKPGAWIRLTASVMPITDALQYGFVIWHPTSLWLKSGALVEYEGEWTGKGSGPIWLLRFTEDSPEDKEVILTAMREKEEAGGMLLLALITSASGILLERGAGDDWRQCRRRGSFEILRTDYSAEKTKAGRSPGFESIAPRETLKII
ncbi:heterokaryon incompatibility protein-domain-containing protein [Triangularia verruculosa]|uniref:Heterokaryon incompatibility protein-domain-containing protein n=1 Tax=Triangularia verruculosa TaxID=2587418 RepID=A0AAN7AW19_9PEZI|nr:heterokaryon incompatibility protein-domain-containing protein [Triangularia verruculosa]